MIKTIQQNLSSHTGVLYGYKGVRMVLGMLGGHGVQETAHGKNIIMKQEIKKRYVNIKDVSEYTSLPVKTLYEWAGQGKIPSIKMGRRVLFDLRDVGRVMDSLKRPYNQHEKTVNNIVGGIHGNVYNTADSVIQTKSGFGKGGTNV